VAGILIVAVGVTLYLGVSGVIGGLAHLQGVIANATTRNYAYDFRLAGLLLVGIMIVYGGVLCLSAVRGLVRHQRRAWDRAMGGTLLLLLVCIPLIPVQRDMAGGGTIIGAVNLVALMFVRRRLEAS
jgi:hypothetical protein